MRIHTGNGNWIKVKKFGSISYDRQTEDWVFDGWHLDLSEFNPEDTKGYSVSQMALIIVAKQMLSVMLEKKQ